MASLQISEVNRCAFVHIPKTGGTSIERSALFSGVKCGGHSSIQAFVDALGPRRREFYIFSFVRDPWDRLVSAFEYMSRGGGNGGDKLICERYLRQFNGDFGRFVEALATEPELLSLEHFRPQTSFLEDAQGRMGVDFVGRFESLAADFERICGDIGCQGIRLKHLRTKGRSWGARLGIALLDRMGVDSTSFSRRDYRRWFTDRTALLTAQVYKQDATTFGYRFE